MDEINKLNEQLRELNERLANLLRMTKENTQMIKNITRGYKKSISATETIEKLAIYSKIYQN